MLGKGLESLIPKKENDLNNPPSEGSLPAASSGSPLDFKSPQDSSDLSERISSTSQVGFSQNLPQKERYPAVSPPRTLPSKISTESVFQIEVDSIQPNPHQPRRDFNEAALKELAASIREYGVLQPLVVSKIEKESESGTSVQYELIAGERRLLAAKMAGLRTVPAIIRRPQVEREKLELAIIENIQRADLNPIETARALARLQDEFRLTQREIAAKVGKSREAVANSIRLLNLPSDIQKAVEDGKISESQARMLLAVEDIVSQRRLFEEILKNNLSVREIRTRLRKIKSPEPAAAQTKEDDIDPELAALKEQLEEFLGTKIDLSRAGEMGKIIISFYSKEELQAIAQKLLRHLSQSDNQSL